MTIILFLLLLSFLVIIHELGHFLAALWMKVQIKEFGIGYPPRAFTFFKWRGIPFTMNWLPFGGFVLMEGENGEESVETLPTEIVKEKSPAVDRHHTFADHQPFYNRSKRARLLVLLAGVAINFVFGVLAFALIYTKMGIPTLNENIARIGIIQPNSPAEQAGLKPGDLVTHYVTTTEAKYGENGDVLMQGEWDEIAVTDSDELAAFISSNAGKEVTLLIQRLNGQEETLKVYSRPESERPAGEGAIGITFDPVEFKFYPWWQMPFRGVWTGLQQSLALSWMIVQAFVDIFVKLFTQGQVPKDVAGPIGIVHQAGKMGLFQEGWVTVLNFAAMLSINLAILNVLPIPALDGGRALFVILETVIGKKRREQIEGRLNYVGYGMLLLLIVAITFKDVVAVIKDVAR